MALLRDFPDQGLSRRMGYRAWHHGINKLVDVRSCSFESTGGEALVALPNQPKIAFRAYMRDLVLLEDTGRDDVKGNPIFEGDIVRASLQNEFGSFQIKEGPVFFDADKWGFLVEFDLDESIDITGIVVDAEVIGNIFETHAEPILLTDKSTTID